MKSVKKFRVQSLEFGINQSSVFCRLSSMFILASVVCLLTSGVFAGTGTSSAEFLTIGIGARAIGMGGAFTGLADDVSAGYWNPGVWCRLTILKC